MAPPSRKATPPLPVNLTLVLVMALLATACRPAIRPLPQARHTETRWQVAASLPLDALAFLNALTGDPLVGEHYAGETSRFASGFTTAEEQAASRLANFREETLRANLSGFLCPWFLAGKPQTLEDLVDLASHPETLRQALLAYDRSGVELNVYYNDEAWKNFQDALPDVRTLLVYLAAAGFSDYWEAEVLPGLQADVARVQAQVQSTNPIPTIETILGFGLPSGEVQVSLLHFVWPYGHHLIGAHFVTIPGDTGVLRSTVHELLHNPFNNTDPAFWEAADALKGRGEIWAAFEGRDPHYGYNDWPYYVAEDSVRALEQLLEVKLGLGERWSWAEDGGMHRLAAALYECMQREGFPQGGESYQAFFIRMVKEDKLWNGSSTPED